MPRVVSYWQLPPDETEFLQFVTSTDQVAAYPSSWVRQKEELTGVELSRIVFANSPTQLLLGPLGLENHQMIDRHLVDGCEWFSMSPMKSCVLVYNRGHLCESRLSRSNLCGYYEYPNIDATAFVDKQDTFIEWSERVFAWIFKRIASKVEFNGMQCRATPRVSEAVARKEIELVAY